jgi:hypothetical protein
VRFRNLLDLDDDQVGEVEPLMPLQDQIDFTTFGLLVAQHYQSFRQRYIIGWTTDDENEKAKAGASRMWTFDDGGGEGRRVRRESTSPATSTRARRRCSTWRRSARRRRIICSASS